MPEKKENQYKGCLLILLVLMIPVTLAFWGDIKKSFKSNDEEQVSTSESTGTYNEESGFDSSKYETLAMNHCSECGREMNSNAPEYKGDVVSDYAPYYVCGDACQREHIIKKMRAEMTPAPSDNYEMGSDGRVYETTACQLCNGTGVEVATASNPATGERERRICPVCEGRGVQSY